MKHIVTQWKKISNVEVLEEIVTCNIAKHAALAIVTCCMQHANAACHHHMQHC